MLPSMSQINHFKYQSIIYIGFIRVLYLFVYIFEKELYYLLQELVVCIQSYVDKMTISLSVDENTIPDPYQLCDDIVESLKVIKDTVIKKGLVN